MFRRLQGRLDQLQGNANFTLAQAQEVIELGRALVEDIADGIAVQVSVDEGAAKTLSAMIFKFRAGVLPFHIQVDPTFDTLPGEVCDFVGGPHDGKQFRMNEDQRTRKTFIAASQMGSVVYTWTGHHFEFEGPAEAEDVDGE